MPYAPSSTRRGDFESTDSFACNSEELEAIIKGTMGKVGGFVDDNPPPFEESSHSFSENAGDNTTTNNNATADPSLRMSFARWTAEDKQSWNCNFCTVVNEPLHLVCGCCGKAKGSKADDVAAAASNSCSSLDNQELEFDEDQFMEQLRQERHNEVLELQESILSQAAMEMSVRDTSAGNNNNNASYNPQPQQQSSSRRGREQQTNSPPPAPAAARPQSPPRQPGAHAQSPNAAVSAIRPAESAVFLGMSEAEAMEMRKILSMTSSAADHTTSTNTASTASAPSNLSGAQAPARDQRRREAAETPNRNNNNNNGINNSASRRPWEHAEDDLMEMKRASGILSGAAHPSRPGAMASSCRTAGANDANERPSASLERQRLCQSNTTGPDHRRERFAEDNTRSPAANPRARQQMERSPSVAVDQDVMAKIAARSRDCYEDLPRLTTMAAAPAPAPAVRPGAYSNRPGAKPVRNDSLAGRKKAAANPGSCSSPKETPISNNTQATTSPEPNSRAAAEEEKLRKEEANSKVQASPARRNRFAPRTTPTARASSGLALDDDMLRMIVEGCDDVEEAMESPPVSPKHGPKNSKDRGGMLQKAWKATAEDAAESKKEKEGTRANLTKAAKGFMKNRLPFRKKS